MVYTAPQTRKPSVASLLSGIVTDAQSLLALELTAVRLEVEHELRRQKKRAIRLGFGIGVNAIAGMLLAFMLVHGLAAYTAMPLWSCYGLIGGLLAAVGITLCYTRKGSSEDAEEIPVQKAQTVKEDRQWITSQAESGRT